MATDTVTGYETCVVCAGVFPVGWCSENEHRFCCPDDDPPVVEGVA
jgi:hypothetical protein